MEHSELSPGGESHQGMMQLTSREATTGLEGQRVHVQKTPYLETWLYLLGMIMMEVLHHKNGQNADAVIFF